MVPETIICVLVERALELGITSRVELVQSRNLELELEPIMPEHLATLIRKTYRIAFRLPGAIY